MSDNVNRRKFLKSVATTGFAAGTLRNLVGSAAALDQELIVTIDEIDELVTNQAEFEDTAKNTSEESYNGRLALHREVANTSTLGYKYSDLTGSGWEHTMQLTGVASAIKKDPVHGETGAGQFEGVGFDAHFSKQDWSNYQPGDDWYIDFTQQKRGVTSFGGSGSLEIPPGTEIAAEIAITTIIGAFSVPAGAAAAVTLGVDEFIEQLDPKAGDDTMDYGGVSFFAKDDVYDLEESCVGYNQEFEVVHNREAAGMNFEVTGKTWNRHANHLGYGIAPNTTLSGIAFNGNAVVSVGPASTMETLDKSELPDTADPKEMTKEQRETYGIRKVDPSVQSLLAEKRETNGDKVYWTTK